MQSIVQHTLKHQISTNTISWSQYYFEFYRQPCNYHGFKNWIGPAGHSSSTVQPDGLEMG